MLQFHSLPKQLPSALQQENFVNKSASDHDERAMGSKATLRLAIPLASADVASPADVSGTWVSPVT